MSRRTRGDLMGQARAMRADENIGHEVVSHLHLKGEDVVVGVHEEEDLAVHLCLSCYFFKVFDAFLVVGDDA